jgi:hypothetical protein
MTSVPKDAGVPRLVGLGFREPSRQILETARVSEAAQMNDHGGRNSMTTRVNFFAAFSLLLCISAYGQSPNPNEVQIGPIPLVQPINGVSITVPVTTFMSVETKPEGLFLNARVIASLSDLQNKVGSIVDTFPFPTDNCRSYSANNPVVRIWGKQLTGSGNAIVLKLSGDVDVWDCRQNPIPNSKVEWRNDGPLHLSIPHVVTWPGSPIKNKLLNQPVTASLPATLGAPNDQTIAVSLGNPSVTLGGTYAGITNGLLNIAGININAIAKQMLDKAVDPSFLKQAIPNEYTSLNPKIIGATFSTDGSTVSATVTLSAKVPAAELTDLIKLLVEKKATP